jgi:hypothetical protein
MPRAPRVCTNKCYQGIQMAADKHPATAAELFDLERDQ